MAITYAQSANILRYNFGLTAYSVPNPLYIGLSFVTPGNDGTNLKEPTGGNYLRVEYGNTDTNWLYDAVNKRIYNASSITFQTSSAKWINGSNTELNYLFISSEQTQTDYTKILYFQVLAEPITVETNTTVMFPGSSLYINMDNPA